VPTRPKQPCRQPNCPELADNGFCTEHAPEADRRANWRESSTKRGYDAVWRRLRLFILRRDKYLCQHCLRQGVVTVATDVDHIIPLSRGGARLDPANLQGLCETCHNRKTAADNAPKVGDATGRL